MDDREFSRSQVCVLCDVKLKRWKDYEAHITGHRHRYEVKQEILKEQHFKSIGRKHVAEYRCALCLKIYDGAQRYYRHLIDRHPSRPVHDEASYSEGRTSIKVCKLCNIELPDRHSYEEHLRSEYHHCAIKHKELMKKGYEMQSETKSKAGSSGYRNSSSGYKCRFCDAFHRSKELLNSHIWSEHPEIAPSVLWRDS